MLSLRFNGALECPRILALPEDRRVVLPFEDLMSRAFEHRQPISVGKDQRSEGSGESLDNGSEPQSLLFAEFSVKPLLQNAYWRPKHESDHEPETRRHEPAAKRNEEYNPRLLGRQYERFSRQALGPHRF